MIEKNKNIDVTIVCVPRERFSCVEDSLESILNTTTYPYKLIYVDGNFPNKVQNYLEQKSKDKDFKLIRTDYYLSPNHARNMALKMVDTKYVIFIDNDVIVALLWI